MTWPDGNYVTFGYDGLNRQTARNILKNQAMGVTPMTNGKGMQEMA